MARSSELRISLLDLQPVAELVALVVSEHQPVVSHGDCGHTHCAVCTYFVEGEGTFYTRWPCPYAEALMNLADDGGHRLEVTHHAD